MTKKPELDKETIQIARRLLSTPPKPHGDMKGKRRPNKRSTTRRATASAKPKTA